jgi:hypothetical protein
LQAGSDLKEDEVVVENPEPEDDDVNGQDQVNAVLPVA